MPEISVTGTIGGKEFVLSTGKLAGQADGAVVARLGGTEMLVTATANRKMREGVDFFPLTVDFEERMYSVGKIPGSFFRREGRPSEQAILTCRLIDRPLRPSFSDDYRNETHVVITSLAVDQENPFDVVALNGASAALRVSPIPFQGPIGGVRLGSQEGGVDPLPDPCRSRRVGVRAGGRRWSQRRGRDRHHHGRGRFDAQRPASDRRRAMPRRMRPPSPGVSKRPRPTSAS